MSMIEDIKRDTVEGRWMVNPNMKEVVTYDTGDIVVHDEYGLMDDRELRRIARVPDMEAALLAADELAAEVQEYATHKKNGAPHNPRNPKVFAALAAYRAATGSAA